MAQAAHELENNIYIFWAVSHEIEFLGKTDTSLQGHHNETGRICPVDDKTLIDHSKATFEYYCKSGVYVTIALLAFYHAALEILTFSNDSE